jgi:putative endonuclease
MEFFVYILYSVTADKYYVGHTENIARRLIEHNNNQTRYTSTLAKDWVVKYSKSYSTRTEAMKAERTIKSKKSRKYIELLIG